jgi:hypothetical protein
MPFMLVSVAWFVVLLFSICLCRAAARGDDVPARLRAERIAISYLAEHDEALVVGAVEQLPYDVR